MSVVTDLPAPPAHRLRPPSWRDPRLLVGVLLVLGSVVLGARVVAVADDTVPYYAAARALTPGDRLGPDDLRVVDVRLGDAGASYLSATAAPGDDLVVTRTVAAGELVPRSSVGTADQVALQPVAVPVEVLPDGLRAGSVVDVWVAQPDPDRAGAFTEPTRVVQGADVAGVTDGGSSLGSTGASSVQVLLAPQDLPVVLGALANDAVLSLVPAPGQGG